LKHERNPIDRIPVTIIACTGKYQFVWWKIYSHHL
jgi:hypothetical protein